MRAVGKKGNQKDPTETERKAKKKKRKDSASRREREREEREKREREPVERNREGHRAEEQAFHVILFLFVCFFLCLFFALHRFALVFVFDCNTVTCCCIYISAASVICLCLRHFTSQKKKVTKQTNITNRRRLRYLIELRWFGGEKRQQQQLCSAQRC